MDKELIKSFDSVIQYLDLALDAINNRKDEIVLELKHWNYSISVSLLKEKLCLIKGIISKWYDKYKTSGDILCINIKEYNKVSRECANLVDEAKLTNGLYIDLIDLIVSDIGEELSEAIVSGGRIDNIDIHKIFNLFITSLNKMIEDDFYFDDNANIVNLKELVLIWQNLYNETNSLITIPYLKIKKIYEYVNLICNKYKMIEDIAKNYAENVQYCYVKLEAMRKVEISDTK